MLRWIFSPCDSWVTPICSERNRDLVPILAATTWSMDGPPAPRPVYGMPGHDGAHGLVVPVARAGQLRGGIIDAADDVNVVAQ